MTRALLPVFFSLAAATAQAQPAPTAGDAPPSPGSTAPANAAPRARPLTLVCALPGRPDLSPQEVREAIARELGGDVVLTAAGRADLELAVERPNQARLRFVRPEGEPLVRRVELPEDTARALDVIAWLAGNLARDEAAELLARYRLERAEKARADAEAAARQSSTAAAPLTKPAEVAPAAAAKPRPPAPERTATDAASPLAPAVLNLSLFHPISLYGDSHERRVNIELGLAYGRLGALHGGALELGLLRVGGPLHGAAFAGVLLNRGPTVGYTAGLFYSGGGDLTGADTSFIGYRDGDVEGALLATAFARAEDVDGAIGTAGIAISNDVRGATLAVVANVSRSTEGVAAAAGVNVVGRVEGAALAAGANFGDSVEGVAAAAGANLIERVDGAALTAGVNLSREVDGAQLGVVNVAGHVRGLQLGVVNVAEEVDGTAIGVVSLARNGDVQVNAWASNFAPLHASLKFRVGFAYSELGAGYDPASDEYVLEQGLGLHLPLFGPLVLEPGVHHSVTTPDDQVPGEGEARHHLHYRARAGYGLGKHLELFAGGGVRHAAWGDDVGELSPEVFAGVGVR